MLLVTVSYVLASWIRLDFFDGYSDNMAAIRPKTIFLAIAYSMILFFMLSMTGFYNTTRTRKLTWKTRTIVFAVTLATLIATTLLFVFRLVDFSRGVLLVFYLLTNLTLIGKYTFMRLVLRRFRGKGFNLKHVIVVGTGELARQYADDIEREPELGFHIVGFIGDPKRAGETDSWLGSFDMVDQLLSSPEIREVVIALEPDEYSLIWSVIPACERNGVKYSVVPFYNNLIPSSPVIETIGKTKLINMRTNRLENLGWSILKRGFDLLVSGLGLIILSPFFIFIAIGVKLSSPGPVFFRQVRVGYERKEFVMLKFRSLRVNEKENTAWTRDRDPRRTKFGTFIRKTSLDELPQLWNTFKGDMSLVGPRPELPYFVEQFRETIPYYMVKHQVKPGMTGWAQVNGFRGDTSIEERIRFDLWYIDNWSVWLDIKILFRTFFGGMINKEKIYSEKERKG